MQARRIFHAVSPFVSALAVIATAVVLVLTIYFTNLGIQWTTFLIGVLVAAILAEAANLAHAEWMVMRKTVQLSSARSKLDNEMHLRKTAEGLNYASKQRLNLIDEVLPTMVAFIDIEGRCQYHNRAFRDGLRLRHDQIHNRHMREVLGVKVYQETAAAVRQSLSGLPAHYERTQTMPDGAVYRLSVDHLPQFDDNGKVSGFHMLINDITSPLHLSGQPGSRESSDSVAEMTDSVQSGKDSQSMFVNSFSEQITGLKDESQVMIAIEKGQFSLLCQQIAPLAADSGEACHFEILVRLIEEEERMTPPGAFFPLAEKYGLMLSLDRWVVQHVTEFVSRQHAQNGSMFFINVSEATICDPGFPEFMQLTLLEYDVVGTALCFEVSDSELALRTQEVAEFARRVRQCGCRVAISGFGRERVLFDLIRDFQVEFLKIDGSVIFDILRDPVALAKITAINRVAKKIGVKTIAELVEGEDTIAKLKEVGIDFAQGFGISRPKLLIEQEEIK